MGGRRWRRRLEKTKRTKDKRKWRSRGEKKLPSRRKRKNPPQAAVTVRTVRKRSAEGRRRAKEKADHRREVKEIAGAGVERSAGKEVEAAAGGAGVGQEVGKMITGGETTAEKRRGGVEVGAGEREGGRVERGKGAGAAAKR